MTLKAFLQQFAVRQTSRRRRPSIPVKNGSHRADVAWLRKNVAESLEDRTLLATFTVTSLSDGAVNIAGDQPGTLRQAIFDANANPDPDTIDFQPGLTGTILITQGRIGHY